MIILNKSNHKQCYLPANSWTTLALIRTNFIQVKEDSGSLKWKAIYYRAMVYLAHIQARCLENKGKHWEDIAFYVMIILWQVPFIVSTFLWLPLFSEIKSDVSLGFIGFKWWSGLIWPIHLIDCDVWIAVKLLSSFLCLNQLFISQYYIMYFNSLFGNAKVWRWLK